MINRHPVNIACAAGLSSKPDQSDDGRCGYRSLLFQISLLLALAFVAPAIHAQSCQATPAAYVWSYWNFGPTGPQGTAPTASAACQAYVGWLVTNTPPNPNTQLILSAPVSPGSSQIPAPGYAAGCYTYNYLNNFAPGNVEEITVGFSVEGGPCPEFWVQATTSEVCTKNCVGDPINPSNGDVYLIENDILFAGASSALAWRRFYNSSDLAGDDAVPGWRHSYGRSVQAVETPPYATYPGASAVVSPQYPTATEACTEGFAAIKAAIPGWTAGTATFSGSSTGGVCTITVNSIVVGYLQIYGNPPPAATGTPYEYDLIRDNGQTLRYPVVGGLTVNPPGVSIRLTVSGSGYTVTDDDDNVEVYSSTGQLQSITSRAGVKQTMSYDTYGLLQAVTDSFGNSLTVARYNESSGINSIEIRAGPAS